MDQGTRDKLRAKRFSERVKLLVTTVNATALVIFGAGVLQPLVASGASVVSFSPFHSVWIALSIALHLLAQALLRLLRAE